MLKGKRFWDLDPGDLGGNVPAPGTLPVMRDAVVSIDLDSLA